ncbi:hypothetical protein GIB67_001639 [Kingdonia uniflora]|uniref:Small auxin up regulated protein n=1 Tax=Kingdonia uniflora TaxID=39325 RepID=A0A7J7L0R7_9MAGN|nr:hypothetical protein GIB67_001639 [Kingdonia uniflora]
MGTHEDHQHHQKGIKDIPKGYLAILVGQEGEVKQRCVVPVLYLNHPLFKQLLEEAERVYGFDQKGNIIIPCNVEEFRNVQDTIDQENHQQHFKCFGG